ncbi:hypothetical protein [Erythrobacter sp. MTPC3]|uniref:hypothetical protein n=1 Tax=Erythrobacter sp. MTPC3 TaxID=3056564 RepID=UPI0036F2FBAD
MTPITWIGIAGTALALVFLIAAIRKLRTAQTGHTANAARIHIPVVLAFLPILWLVVLFMQG